MDTPTRVTQLRRSLVVVSVGAIASLIGWWAATSADQSEVHLELKHRARLHAQILEARFSDLEHPVITTADFVAADHDVIAADFNRFARSVAPHAVTVRWLGWAPLVRDADRAVFGIRARQVWPGFHISDRSAGGALVPAPRRREYFPLYAVKQFGAGGALVGLDLVGNAAQRVIAERARDEDRAMASGPFAGADPKNPGETIVLIAPIYRQDETLPHDMASRRQALTGYVVGAYALDQALAYLTAGVAEPDETISFVPPGLVAGAGPAPKRSSGAQAAGIAPPPPRGGYRSIQPLVFSGQRWIATFTFSPDAVAVRRSDAPFGWLGAGLLLTAVLGTVTARGETRRLATERLVVTRTRELSAANERLHQSAEMLHATLEATPLGIIALDREARISLWNSGAERIFGHQAADVLGRSYIELVVPEEHRMTARGLHARINAGEPLRDVEVQRQRRDGAVLDIRVAGNPLYDAAGKLRGTVYANEDITESRKLEAQLRQAQKMEAIGQLTGGVAHDFNNLLGTAITSLDLLRDRLKYNAEGDELAAHALDALLHGADLVRRLLAFARRQPLQPECVMLNELVLEAVRLLRPLLGDAIEIELDLGDALWPVLVDRAQFETTLINLATNGRDAMPHGGRLTITTRNARVAEAADPVSDVPPGEYVAISVRDTGTGMPPALLQRIFEPFFTTKGKTVGTGLGLSMVLGFIKQSGGHISVDSEEGHGSCFQLYVSRYEQGEAEVTQAVDGRTLDREPMNRGACVLVVEDNPGLRHIVLQQLTKFGYRVVEAENAVAALAILEGGRHVDLLFSDVVMPGGMGGVELACLVRARWPGLRILLTSGFPEVLVKGAPTLAGVRLLGKPYREEALSRALREALAG